MADHYLRSRNRILDRIGGLLANGASIVTLRGAPGEGKDFIAAAFEDRFAPRSPLAERFQIGADRLTSASDLQQRIVKEVARAAGVGWEPVRDKLSDVPTLLTLNDFSVDEGRVAEVVKFLHALVRRTKAQVLITKVGPVVSGLEGEEVLVEPLSMEESYLLFLEYAGWPKPASPIAQQLLKTAVHDQTKGNAALIALLGRIKSSSDPRGGLASDFQLTREQCKEAGRSVSDSIDRAIKTLPASLREPAIRLLALVYRFPNGLPEKELAQIWKEVDPDPPMRDVLAALTHYGLAQVGGSDGGGPPAHVGSALARHGIAQDISERIALHDTGERIMLCAPLRACVPACLREEAVVAQLAKPGTVGWMLAQDYLERLNQHASEVGRSRGRNILAWFEREEGNVTESLSLLLQSPQPAAGFQALGTYARIVKYFSKLHMEVFELAVSAAERLKDAAWYAECRCYQAETERWSVGLEAGGKLPMYRLGGPVKKFEDALEMQPGGASATGPLAARCWLGLGDCQLDQKNSAEALKNYEHAAAALGKNQDDLLRGAIHEGRAEAWLLKKDVVEAARELAQAEEWYRRSEWLLGSANCLVLRGELESADSDRAEICYGHAFRLFRKIGDRYSQARVSQKRALLHPHEQQTHLLDAVDLYRDIDWQAKAWQARARRF